MTAAGVVHGTPSGARAVLTPSRVVLVVVLAGVVLAGPLVLGTYWTRIITVCAIYAIASGGTVLLYGRLGLVSLNQVATLGVGAWITMRVGHATGLPFEVDLLVSFVLTAAIGVVVGLPALRLSGLSLAIVTLMFAGAFEVVFDVTGFPNGGGGFLGRSGGLQTRLPRPLLGQSDAAYYRYVLIVAIVLFAVLSLHLHSRPGRAWAAIRQSEAGALSAGANTVAYRLWALAIVSGTTGIAGGLLAGVDGLLDPIAFGAEQSILLFATTLIGGGFALGGAVIAGLLSQGLPSLLNALGLDGNLIFVLLGLGMVQAITTAPKGIAGQLQALALRLRRRRRTTGDGTGRTP